MRNIYGIVLLTGALVIAGVAFAGAMPPSHPYTVENVLADRANTIALASAIASAIGTLLVAITLFINAEASRAATIAARAAKDAVDHSRRSAEVQLRPYVAVSDWNNIWIHEEGSEEIISRRVDIIWKNVGLTPARKVLTSAYWEYRETPPPADFQYRHPDDTEPTHISPNTTIECSLFIPSDILAKAFNNEGIIYIWAMCSYVGLSESLSHVTAAHRTVVMRGSPLEKDSSMWFRVAGDFEDIYDIRR